MVRSQRLCGALTRRRRFGEATPEHESQLGLRSGKATSFFVVAAQRLLSGVDAVHTNLNLKSNVAAHYAAFERPPFASRCNTGIARRSATASSTRA